MKASYNIDSNRIYADGLSNGGGIDSDYSAGIPLIQWHRESERLLHVDRDLDCGMA